MKKIISFILFFFVNICIFAESTSKILTKELVDEICIQKGTDRKSVTEFIIPSEYSIIGEYAFEGCSKLKIIQISNNVKEIYNCAFVTTSISELIIPENVMSIGKYIFGKCYNLRYVSFYSKNPPIITTNQQDTFYSGNSKNIIFYVPDENIEDYQQAYKNYEYCQIQALSNKDIINLNSSELNDENEIRSDSNSEITAGDVLILLILLFLIILFIVHLIKKVINMNNNLNEKMNLLNNGILTPVDSKIVLLTKDEICYFYNNVVFLKEKEKVIGYNGGGSGVSFRIAKGLSIHTGSGSKKAIRGNVIQEQLGTLTITNKRIVGTSIKLSFDKKIDSLTSIEINYQNILLQFGKEQFYFRSFEAKCIEKIIHLILQKLK